MSREMAAESPCASMLVGNERLWHFHFCCRGNGKSRRSFSPGKAAPHGSRHSTAKVKMPWLSELLDELVDALIEAHMHTEELAFARNLRRHAPSLLMAPKNQIDPHKHASRH